MSEITGAWIDELPDAPWWHWWLATLFGKRRVVECEGLRFVVYRWRGVDYVCSLVKK